MKFKRERRTAAAVAKPHGPVSERFMRHYYGAAKGAVVQEITILASEYAQLVRDARRYEWLRDNMRRFTTCGGIRHFIDQPDSMSFQEAVDEAMNAEGDR